MTIFKNTIILWITFSIILIITMYLKDGHNGLVYGIYFSLTGVLFSSFSLSLLYFLIKKYVIYQTSWAIVATLFIAALYFIESLYFYRHSRIFFRFFYNLF